MTELLGQPTAAKPWREDLLQWYQRERRVLPWRDPDQAWCPVFAVWVSEIMLQQTQIVTVIPVFTWFMERFPSVHAFAEASEAEVRLATAGLGYYRRFRLLHQAAVALCERHQAGAILWPQDATQWRLLPGVGPYTAAALASIVNGQPIGVLDGNVERVLCRYLAWKVVPRQPQVKAHLQALMDAWVCPAAPGDFNQAAMELGQRICTPRAPRCDLCPLGVTCRSRHDPTQAPLPNPRPQVTRQELAAVLSLGASGAWGLCRRSAGNSAFLHGSVGFCLQPEPPTDATELGAFRHTITRYRLSVTVWVRPQPAAAEQAGRCWVAAEHVEGLLSTALDRKVYSIVSRKIPAPQNKNESKHVARKGAPNPNPLALS